MSWTLAYEGFDPAAEGLRESLCTLGNGRFATRGAAADADADPVHYPGTYVAGCYDRLVSQVADRAVENEDLVNWPNWLPIRVRIGDGPWLSAETAQVVAHAQVLDLRAGTLTRRTVLRDGEGRVVALAETRLVSMADPLLAAQTLSITAHDWAGPITVRTFLDGSVENRGVARYRDLAGRHLIVEDATHEGRLARLSCRTVQSDIHTTVAMRLGGPGGEATDIVPWRGGERIGFDTVIDLESGRARQLEKVVALVTSKDAAISSPELTATEAARDAAGFEALLDAHRTAWAARWDDFDVRLDDHASKVQRNLRLHIFHLCQTVSPHTAELDAGVPARGWHGEAYRGHVFWDELFVFRVLNLRAPRLARELLRYRHRRLPAARRLAAEAGYAGAMYPWQSGSDGREETQTLHLNPRSGRWLPDVTHRQRHVGLAIAYNVWNYYRSTNDVDFMIEAGAEMMVEIARFFTSLATFGEASGRYHILGVMGPDEFHTAYPGADPTREGGIDDNAYTNVMCAWALARTVDALENLPPGRRERLAIRLALRQEEMHRWQEISESMFVPFLANGLIAQFDGYDALEELDWDAYRVRYGDIHRLDRLLEAEGRAVNAYKASKQADVLMLPFLFSAEVLVQIFEQLGLAFDPADLPRTVAYYDERTSHGSTLSIIVDAWVVARTSRARSWELFVSALRADVDDVQGGTTPEGIHLGAMCGTIDMVQNGYLGCEVRGDALHIDPVLPEALSGIATQVRYRGQDVTIEATRQEVRVTAGAGGADTILLIYRGRQRRLPPGTTTSFRLVRPDRKRALGGAADAADPGASPGDAAPATN